MIRRTLSLLLILLIISIGLIITDSGVKDKSIEIPIATTSEKIEINENNNIASTNKLGHGTFKLTGEDSVVSKWNRYIKIDSGLSKGDDAAYIWEVAKNENGLTLKGYLGDQVNLIIPSRIQGMEVTVIGEFAFYENNRMHSITIPDSVTEIESSAFLYCANLTEINLPNSIAHIGSSAFDGCYELKQIILPEKLTTISAYTFSLCKSLTNIVIPSSVTVIEDEAFSKCLSLESITILGNDVIMGKNIIDFSNVFREIYQTHGSGVYTLTQLKSWTFSKP